METEPKNWFKRLTDGVMGGALGVGVGLSTAPALQHESPEYESIQENKIVEPFKRSLPYSTEVTKDPEVRKEVRKDPEVQNIFQQENSSDSIQSDKIYETFDLISAVSPMIKEHEGLELKTYLDTRGFPTIGYGFNLARSGARERIESIGLDYDLVVSGKQQLTQKQADILFEEDLKDLIKYLPSVFPDYKSHPQTVQVILADMLFNMGPSKLSGFVRMKKALDNRDYSSAADEMKNSQWYGQVGYRSKKLVNMMRNVN